MSRSLERLLALLVVLVAPPWTVAAGGPQAVAPSTPARAAAQTARDAATARALIELSRILPPEFKADVLIRLADSGKIRSRRTTIDVLEEAFWAASAAQEPVKLDPVSSGRVGMREFVRARALVNHLDQLSLQTRVVRSLAAVDVKTALELQGLFRIELPPLRCEDALAYDLANVYKNLAVFASLLPERERFLILQRHVLGMTSAVQVAPTAELLTQVPLPRQDRALLVRALGRELQRMSDADRTFTISIVRDHMPERLTDLGEVSRRQEDDPGVLVEGFRSFLVRHFSARRCADGFDGPDLRVTQWFNEDVRALTASTVQRINYDEYGGRRTGGRAIMHDMDDTAGHAALVGEIAASFPLPRGRIAPVNFPSIYAKPVEVVVGNVLVWQGQGERLADFLYKKATLLARLLKEVPSGALHDLVLDDLVTFLTSAGQGVESRLEWFLHVNALLDYARRAPRHEHDKILRLLEGCGNPVMSAYGALERIAPLRALRE